MNTYDWLGQYSVGMLLNHGMIRILKMTKFAEVELGRRQDRSSKSRFRSDGGRLCPGSKLLLNIVLKMAIHVCFAGRGDDHIQNWNESESGELSIST